MTNEPPNTDRERSDLLPWIDGRLPDLLSVVVLLAAIVAAPSDDLAVRPVIWEIGRGLAAGCAILVFWGRRAETEIGDAVTAGGLVTGVVALTALLGRNPEWNLSPFAHTTPTLWSLPSALAFAGLAVAALALYRRPDSNWGRGIFAAALPWATAVVFMPHWWLRESSFPLYTALDLVVESEGGIAAGGTLIAVVLPVVGAWGVALAAVWTGERDNSEKFESMRPALALAAFGVAILMAYHLVAPAATGEATWSHVASGVLVAALLGLVTVAGVRWVDARADRAFPEQPAAYAGLAIDILVPGLVLVTYYLLKTHGMVPADTDENIYFYMANDLAERGRWPYVDYFFAHPPLHVLIPGVVFEVVGYSFTLAKHFSALAGAISALAVWAIARQHFGRLAAAIAMISLVFSAQWLDSTSHMTGVNLTVMFMVVGFWLSLSGRMIWAGLSFGLAASTGFYSAAAICAALALAFFKRLEDGTRQLAAFAVVFGGINLAFWLAAGDAYLEGVYVYHGLKPAQNPEMVPILGAPNNPVSSVLHNLSVMLQGDPFSKDLFHVAHLWLAGLLTPLALLLRWIIEPERERAFWRFVDFRRIWDADAGADSKALWLALVAAALFVQYAMFRELYAYYWTLIHPLLALTLGYVVYRGWEFGRRSIESTHDAVWSGGLRVGHLAGAILVFGVLTQWQAAAVGGAEAFDLEENQIGTRETFDLDPAPVLPSLTGFVRTFFWKGHRLKGNRQHGYLYYLWTQKREFASLPKIAGWVRNHTDVDETIAGASTITPLVALRANRRVAAGEPDTNNSRFETGLLEFPDYWRRACRDQLKVLVSAPETFFDPENLRRLPAARRWFPHVKIFRDSELKAGYTYSIVLLKRVETADESGVVCRWEPMKQDR